MKETGVVKFHYQSDHKSLPFFPGFAELNEARRELRQLGLLGMDENGVGFGNVSLRSEAGDEFFITGSGTGGLDSLGPQNCARVVAWDFARNWLRSEGSATPSAESLTHAAIYESDPEAHVILHGHDLSLWDKLLRLGPSTGLSVTYGTPAMAREVKRLFRETDVATRKLFGMGGHAGGVIAFGKTVPEALTALRQYRD